MSIKMGSRVSVSGFEHASTAIHAYRNGPAVRGCVCTAPIQLCQAEEVERPCCGISQRCKVSHGVAVYGGFLVKAAWAAASLQTQSPGMRQAPEPKTLKLSGTKPEALNPNLSETPKSPEQRLCSCCSSRLNSVIQLPQ